MPSEGGLSIVPEYLRHSLGFPIMRNAQSSATADMCAVIRGYHARFADDPVFPDTVAPALTSDRWWRVMESPFVRRFVIEGALRPLHRAAGTVIGRARYVEDQLEEAIAYGCTQYVIVGAGMDSFAARRNSALPRVRVIELDHPATQRMKRERLASLEGNPAAEVDYVPIDFENDDIMNALRRSSFDPNAITMFSWMGVSYYLPRETVYDVIGQLGACGAPGSQIIFDYSVPSETHDPRRRLATKLVNTITRHVGEPQVSSFECEDVRRRVHELGLDVVEIVTGEELRRSYFENRDDGLEPSSHIRLARIRSSLALV